MGIRLPRPPEEQEKTLVGSGFVRMPEAGRGRKTCEIYGKPMGNISKSIGKYGTSTENMGNVSKSIGNIGVSENGGPPKKVQETTI